MFKITINADKIESIIPAIKASFEGKQVDVIIAITGEIDQSTNDGRNRVKIKDTPDGREIDADMSNESVDKIVETIKNVYNTNNKDNNNNLALKPKTTVDITDAVEVDVATIETEHDEVAPDQANNYPSLEDVSLKTNCSEKDMILVFAFYVSDYGEKTFTSSGVQSKYMELRGTDSRRKNFSKYFKELRIAYFKTVKDSNLFFEQLGIQAVQKIINQEGGKKVGGKKNNEVTKTIKKPAQKEKSKAGKGTTHTYQIVADLNLYPKDKDSLEVFCNRYAFENGHEWNLAFVYYLKQILKIDHVGVNHIYTCYKAAKVMIPENLEQSLRNTKFHKGWINTSNANSLLLEVAGENYIEHYKQTKQ